MYQPTCVVETDAIVGECPTWCDQTQMLYWVDIQGKKIHRYNPKNQVNETFHLPEIVTSLSLYKKDILLLSMRKTVVLYSLATGKLDVLLTIESNKPNNRFNDAKCDPQGKYWIGTMDDKSWMSPSGALYKLTDRSMAQLMQSNVTCSNGMGWSPDQRTMYFTDSFRYTIYAYDFDAATSTVSNKREFVVLDPNGGEFPDGLTVDSDGCVWSAQVGAGKVVRYDPSGLEERVIQLPVPRVTSCTFGNVDLKTLYITSATETMTAQQITEAPLSGSLFAMQTDIVGLPTSRFSG